MSYPEPHYLGEAGEASATIRTADHEPDLVYPNGTRVHYLATGKLTRGLFGLYRWEMAAGGGGPGPHFHRTITESFYVLSGTITIYDGNNWVPSPQERSSTCPMAASTDSETIQASRHRCLSTLRPELRASPTSRAMLGSHEKDYRATKRWPSSGAYTTTCGSKSVSRSRCTDASRAGRSSVVRPGIRRPGRFIGTVGVARTVEVVVVDGVAARGAAEKG